MTKLEKTKEERLKEGISLLKQLLEIVKNEGTPGYPEVKTVITDWIQTGAAYSGRIDFEFYGRYAELSLPRSAKLAATLAFKVKKDEA
jgi:hypothetical protein